MSNALLSQGAEYKKQPKIQIKNRVYILASNLHELGIKCMQLTGDTVTIKERGYKPFTIKSTEYWRIYRDYLNKIFGHALAEALSRSKELPKKSSTDRDFVFSSKGDKE